MLTENMLWAWNVVFACNTESIFLCVSTSEAEPPLLHITTLTTAVPVPVLIPFVVTSRPTTASSPSTPLNPSPFAPQIRLCWPLCAFILYLLTYLLTLHRPTGLDKRFAVSDQLMNIILKLCIGIIATRTSSVSMRGKWSNGETIM